jgi:hypothetical protein
LISRARENENSVFCIRLFYENRSLYHLACVRITEAAEDATSRAERASHRREAAVTNEQSPNTDDEIGKARVHHPTL